MIAYSGSDSASSPIDIHSLTSTAAAFSAMCCRVLVTSAERKKIDDEHAWTVPSSLEWADGIAFGLRTLEPSLIPLIRYHEVDPELARSLIPVGSIHADLIARFKTLI